MTREEKFKNLKSHAWFKRVYSKLSSEDEAFAIDFLQKHSALDKNEFASKAVRIWLDAPSHPKSWKHIEELLIASL